MDGRHRTSHLRAALAAAAGLGALASGLPAQAQTYLEVTTDDFVLVSGAGERRTLEIGRQAAMFADALQGVFGPGVKPTTPTRLYALARADWRLAQLRDGVAGYFAAQPFASDLLFDVETDPPAAQELLFHEYTHYVLRKLGSGKHAAFFDEGLAEVLSRASITDRGIRIEPRPEHIELLRRRGWTPIERLLGVERGEFEYVDRAQAPVFYAHAWAAMYFVVATQPAFAERLLDYVRRTSAGAARSEAFEALLGESLDVANRRIARFIMKERAPAPIALAVGDAGQSATLTPRRLSDAERSLHLANLLLRLGNRNDAAVRLARGVRGDELDRNRARIVEAWAHLQSGDRPRALDMLDYLQPHPALPASEQIMLGRALFEFALHPAPGSSLGAVTVQKRRLTRARDLFRSAMQDRLGWAEATNGYVLASLALHEHDESLVSLASEAYWAAPRSAELALSLAMLHESHGRKAVARRYWTEAAGHLQNGPSRSRVLEQLARLND